MNDILRVIYASDDNYVGLTAVSAVSLLKHNPGAHIHLLGCGLNNNSIDLVKSRVEKFGGKFSYHDISNRIARIVTSGANTYTSPVIYARIFIPEIIEGNGRVLYLDCDTLVCGSLTELFEMDLRGRAMALCPDMIHAAYKKVISISPKTPYYNSGVLLIDLDAWRRANISERFLTELRHPSGRICLPDQDVISRALGDEIVPIESRWNFLSQNFLFNRPAQATVYHFSGNTLGRPWFTSSKHPMRAAYREAAADAGLPEIAEQCRPMPIEYRVQYWLYRLLPQVLFKPICNLMYRAHIRLTYGV